MSREQLETPHNAWLPLPLPLLLLSSLLLLFSSQLCLSLFILPLVQSHYWHFCQSTEQNAVSNSSNQQFPLFFSLPSISDNGWRGQIIYSCHLTVPPPPFLDSASTNICYVQSGSGQSGEGVNAEVKPISMQIVMTSCVPSFLPRPRLFLGGASRGLLGKTSQL